MESHLRITAYERQALLEQYRNGVSTRARLRAHILLLLAEGYSWAVITGFLFCSTRTIAQLPTEPVILMLSSDDVKPQLARLKDLGLDAYLVKPITRTELFEAIRRLLKDANRHGANPIPERRTTETISNNANGVMKILVAEDSPDNRLIIQAYLRREPHQVDFAENGRAAVEKFIAQPYDLVFMDVQMPEVDGLDATRMIREWERKHGIRPSLIIALTASVLDEDVKHTLAAGCSAHIGKPFTKQVILDAIRTASLRVIGTRSQETSDNIVESNNFRNNLLKAE